MSKPLGLEVVLADVPRSTGLEDRLVRWSGCLVSEYCSLTQVEIGNNDSADDMKNVDLTRIHYLSGPFEVETAEPGDILIVEIME